MEIIIGIIIVVIGAVLYFNRKPKATEVAEVPYKVETNVADVPAPSAETPAPVVKTAPAKTTRAKKAPAAKKATARKPKAK